MIRYLLLGMLLTLPAHAQVMNSRVVLHTTVGDIELEVDAEHAPSTTANFLRYVNGGFYDGGSFHRTVTMQNQPDKVVKIEVVQAGINPSLEKKVFPPIEIERTNKTGIHHVDGTVSMARNLPDSANSEFFICIGKQPELDYGGKRNSDGQGFAAFGQVVKGMNIVRKIQSLPANAQNLTPPIKIISAVVVGKSGK